MEDEHGNRLPQLPEPLGPVASAFDMAPLLRDVFREFLERDIVTHSNDAVLKICREMKKASSDLRQAEMEVMKTQAVNMVLKKKMLKETVDINPGIAKKYNLITMNDVKVEKTIDVAELKYLPKDFYINDAVVPRSRPVIEELETSKSKPTWKPRIISPKLVAEPATVVFRTYELGKKYKRTLKIKNISTTPCKVRLHPGDNMDILVETSDGFYSTTLVKGVSWCLTVTFKPSSLEPFENTITIIPVQGEKLMVLVTGKRDPPVLLSGVKGGPSLGLRETFLSGTIDCGTQFVGSFWQQTQNVGNTGSDATFVIINEESWILADLKEQCRQKVTSEPFTLSPTSFTLERGKTTDLTATFAPTAVGTFTEQFTVVCDNNTMRTIDLIGDAVLFFPSTLVIQNASKNYGVMVIDDSNAEYMVDMGTTLPNNVVSRTFRILNRSEVAITYHWELRNIMNCFGNLRNLPTENFEVSPSCGCMGKLTENYFEVTLKSVGLEYSTYRTVLRLVVDDIPKMSLSPQFEEMVLLEEEKEGIQLVSVLVAEFEVGIIVEAPQVSLCPNIYSFSTYGLRDAIFDVTMNNCSECPVAAVWEVPDLSEYGAVLTICPEQFSINANEYAICICKVSALSNEYENDVSFSKAIKCIFNDGESMIKFYLSGTLFKDEDISTKIFVECLSDTPNCVTDIISLDPIKADGGLAELCSEIIAEKVKQVGGSFAELDCTNEICAKIEEQIDESCDPMESKLLCGLVRWPDKLCGAYTWVISDMTAPDASFSATCLDVNLFRSISYTSKVYIVNHTLVSTIFRWVPFQNPDKLLDISFEPWEGLLLPGEKKEASIIFNPKQVGFVRSMLACRIDNKRTPLCMQLVANINQLQLEFKWFSKKDEITVLWKQRTLRSEDHECIGYSVISYQQKDRCEMNAAPSAELEHVEPERTASSLSLHEVSVLDNLLDELYGSTPLIGGKYRIADPVYDDEEETSYQNLNLSAPVPYSPPKRSTNENAVPVALQTLLDCIFDVMDRKSLYYEINLNERVSKDIIVRNVTPIATTFRVEPHLVPPNYRTLYGDEMMAGSTIGSIYQRNFYKCFGCNIEAFPATSSLDGNSAIRVQLMVEAKAWGEYMDLIVIKTLDKTLPPFSVPVKVVAKGLPIFATFAPNIPRPELDFGVFLPGSKDHRTLTIKNTSSLPLKVAWSVYTIPDNDNRPIEPIPEFTLDADYHHPDVGQMMSVHLLEYIGEHCRNPPYKIDPGVSYFEPYGSANISIILNTERIDLCGKNCVEVKGTLLGLIYIDKELNEVDTPGICHRPQGFSTDQFKIDMTARLEQPLIAVLNFEKGDFIFDVKASEAWKGYRCQRRFLLENQGDSAVDIRLDIGSPFKITSLISPDPYARVNLFRNIINIARKQVATMDIELHLTKDNVPFQEVDDYDYSNPNLDVDPIEAFLNIYIKDNLYQQVSFTYKFIYPIIVPRRERVVFGPVFVGDTKMKYLAIHSQSGDEQFTVTLLNGTEFTVTPKSGLIRGNKFVDLSISFSPKESTGYLDKMVIHSVVPGYATLVTLEGVGTWNYKFHQND